MDNRAPESGPKVPEPDPTIPVKTLVVEDTPDVAELMMRILGTDSHVQSTLTDNAEEALSLLREASKGGGRFDLVVSDLGLAGEMDGLGLAKIVRKEGLATRFSILSASLAPVQLEDPARAQEAGVDKWIMKPFRAASLTAEVKSTRSIIESQSHPSE